MLHGLFRCSVAPHKADIMETDGKVTPALLMSGVRFSYGPGLGAIAVDAFEVAHGEKVFLYGPSGAGKSTLLGLAAGTLDADMGDVVVMGRNFHEISPAERDRTRADSLGIIFQLFNLIPYLSVLDNVLLPCRFSEQRRQKVESEGGLKEVAWSLLTRLGLDEDEFRGRRVGELSVGQQQRVAAARALIGSPGLIIADEPTSALDSASEERFLDLLNTEVARSGAALLFVSHNQTLASHFDREVELRALTPETDEVAS